jgi:hypothetical protein
MQKTHLQVMCHLAVYMNIMPNLECVAYKNGIAPIGNTGIQWIMGLVMIHVHMDYMHINQKWNACIVAQTDIMAIQCHILVLLTVVGQVPAQLGSSMMGQCVLIFAQKVHLQIMQMPSV